MGEQTVNELYATLPDNSHVNRAKTANQTSGNTPAEKKDTDTEKRAEKVVTGKVKTKPNAKRKLTDVFISEDVANVKNYILMDVIVPAVKKAIYDLIVGTLDISLYGGRGSGKRPSVDKISYRDYNSMSRQDTRDVPRSHSVYSYDDIIFSSRGEAEAVLSRMDEIMDEYRMVRVADMYELAGVSGDYTDNKYGWTNIRDAKISKVYDGYKIDMPRAIALR